eukprot:TRINITY_DN1274_c0_g1_i4.p1 TRINITY_DN1274_c0_g1~~TRINITY_DN1274_c0_g1_i4.p1  ORF type:complete len:195 (+),score=73.53 TRINITY_DN1274_c0_g1_i4:48-587(+)
MDASVGAAMLHDDESDSSYELQSEYRRRRRRQQLGGCSRSILDPDATAADAERELKAFLSASFVAFHGENPPDAGPADPIGTAAVTPPEMLSDAELLAAEERARTHLEMLRAELANRGLRASSGSPPARCADPTDGAPIAPRDGSPSAASGGSFRAADSPKAAGADWADAVEEAGDFTF